MSLNEFRWSLHFRKKKHIINRFLERLRNFDRQKNGRNIISFLYSDYRLSCYPGYIRQSLLGQIGAGAKFMHSIVY